MSQSTIFFAAAARFAGGLVFGLKTGRMPTYLTGPASGQNEPVTYWIAATVLAIGFLTCSWVASL